ncbi:MAG TPA: hypothetical protein VFO60_06645, partial [Candidatus Dormibacteraeota bacterium]|nr:hypothetical protein [Candidatus Dormibacteraeota bacterium]
MRREALAAVSAVVVAGCGADSASSTTSSTTTAPTGATAAYCQAFRSYAALSAQLGPDLSVNPDLATIKALIARLATQIDLADADAPA